MFICGFFVNGEKAKTAIFPPKFLIYTDICTK